MMIAEKGSRKKQKIASGAGLLDNDKLIVILETVLHTSSTHPRKARHYSESEVAAMRSHVAEDSKRQA